MPAEIVFAYEEFLAQFLQADFLHIVIMDIIKNRLDGVVLVFQGQSHDRLPLSDQVADIQNEINKCHILAQVIAESAAVGHAVCQEVIEIVKLLFT